ncbi:hypothetical protein [uncultured Rhodospira sp.]|uniref:hypothetical protein n=1 Tax=uncultured Rhodospira sp. TaxID=1936189 RepID=UPI00260844F6|nr:hypothetical protein [uncultured Rhodospira sp.]
MSSEAGANQSLPRADDVLAEIGENDDSAADELSKYERRYIEEYSEASILSELRYAHLIGLHDHYEHKGRWSWFLMLLLFGMVFFQWVLLWFVGEGWWDFTAYEWLLPVVLVQNLGQIIGLAVIVVRSLFKDMFDVKRILSNTKS